jgi:hypothetical protein
VDARRSAVAFTGIELFFMVIDLLEAYSAAPESDTHPPARERLDALRKDLVDEIGFERADALSETAKVLESVLARLRDHILSETWRRAALARQPEFDALLRQPLATYTKGKGGRHIPFASALTEQQSVFAPQVICNGLASEMSRATNDMSAAVDAASRTAASLRLMLLIGFVSTHPEFLDAVAERLPALTHLAGAHLLRRRWRGSCRAPKSSGAL